MPAAPLTAGEVDDLRSTIPFDADRIHLTPHARRFEHWEHHHAAWLGLGVAVDETLAVGTDRIEATIRQQSDHLRERLAENDLPVFDLGIDRCGIVTTTVPGVEPPVARDRLHDAGINVSVTQRASTRWDLERRDLDALLRVSVHATTTDDEIERTIAELASLRDA